MDDYQLVAHDENKARLREVYEVETEGEVYAVKLHTSTLREDAPNVPRTISASITDGEGKALAQDGKPYILPNPMNWTVATGPHVTDDMIEGMRATIVFDVLTRAAAVAKADEAVAPLREIKALELKDLHPTLVAKLLEDGASLTVATDSPAANDGSNKNV